MVLQTDEIDALDEREVDEPLEDEVEAILGDELELPVELIGVPFS